MTSSGDGEQTSRRTTPPEAEPGDSGKRPHAGSLEPIDKSTWACVACGAAWPGAHRFCGHCGSARTGRAAAGSDEGELVDVLRSFVSSQLVDQLLDEGGRIPEQRRLVTALFADLSGFTNLAGQLDPETLGEVVDPLLEGLVRIVQRHEGYVGTFAGDALLAFFGAPVAHEDDAERALRTAQEMLAEFPALKQSAGPIAAPLALRIGVNTGHVLARLMAGDVRTDYSVLGDAVNMAQRMQSVAPIGGCWVGETTWQLTHSTFDLAPMGEVTVKGKDLPVPAWELRGELRSDVRRWQSSGELFVGRRRELEQLQEHVDAGRLVVLRAEAGAGKSRLLDELRTSTPHRRWATGGAAPYDVASSYRPWVGVVGALADDDLELSPQEMDGLRLVLGLASELPELTHAPEGRRRTAALGVLGLLRSVAPVAVALEDLHWADPATLDLLEDVARDLPDGVALIGTTRPQSPAVERLLAAAGEHGQTLDLRALGTDDVAALLRHALGGEPPPGVADQVARRSGGNPLYTSELARALLAGGALRRLESGAYAAQGDPSTLLDVVPSTLEGLLGARMDALPYGCARLLTIAAVVGEPLRPDLLSAVAATTGGDGAVAGPLAELVESGLLVQDGTSFAFVHALVGDAAYARTPRRRRRELHLVVADVAPGVGMDGDAAAGFLARHLYLCAAGPRAVAALQRAADLATARGALAEAVVHLTREAELRRLGDSDRVWLPDRLLVLGEHLETLGRYEDAQPVLREAAELGADWRAQRALAGVLRRSGSYAEAIAVAEEALEHAPDDTAAARLLEERGWSLAATGSVPAALVLAQEALALDVDETVRASAQLLAAYCLMRSGAGEQAAQAARDAAGVFAAVGDLPRQAKAYRLLGGSLRALKRLDQAQVDLHVGLDLAERCGAIEESASCLMALATLYGERSAFEDALTLELRAIDLWDRIGHRFGQVTTRANHALTLHAAGRTAEALACAEDAVTRARRADVRTAAATGLQVISLCRLAMADSEGAALAAEQAASLFVAVNNMLDARELWLLASTAWQRAGKPELAAEARALAADAAAGGRPPAPVRGGQPRDSHI